jgi:adenylylsulfate kinase
MLVEKHSRTLVKTLCWRVIALLATIAGLYLYKGELKSSIAVGLAINAVKMCLYYAHERLWNRIRFGREVVPPPEYNI